ncbi:diiron oxygenase [Kitasatospora sp. NBC_00240]|uniref:AurF N-oxygenase family protein n=1 Tax=Kitasatospora sp. NBC_00240 TaxID=2903567 RepID=UPI00224D0F8F|nr:diiron oxygenase [Kitasatospora sp. NBC_00240]MCX5209419.1 diiron oxygenase [Kitasatospora sp. NBC_00240]
MTDRAAATTAAATATTATAATATATATATTERELNAERLLRVSAKHSHDPLTEIDWDAPLDPDQFAIPPHRVSLYGTPLWDSMTHRQRAQLSVHELASTISAGIWFELILMEGLVRHVYESDLTTKHAQYALTEVADECRHSTMFARYLTKTGYPSARPTRRAQRLGRLHFLINDTTMTFAGAIFVEEFTDALQREMMRDESLQPLARSVARIHVIEEARHIGYAKPELERRWAALSAPRRALFRQALGLLAQQSVAEVIHPRVYALAGLDPRAARQAAAANPHWQQTKAEWARKAVQFFTELGIIDHRSEYRWRRAALLPAARRGR